MRPSGTPDSLEVRRKIAARLFERGMKLSEVAAIVGSSVSSAHLPVQNLVRTLFLSFARENKNLSLVFQ